MGESRHLLTLHHPAAGPGLHLYVVTSLQVVKYQTWETEVSFYPSALHLLCNRKETMNHILTFEIQFQNARLT